jgi:phage repressor protein C with HTH and peptisase S24 domain
VFEPVIPHGSLMYASKARHMQEGDIILVRKTDGVSIVRILRDQHEDGIVVQKGLDPKDVTTIGMDKVDEISVVVMMERP